MALTDGDINFTFSGGGTNTNPDLSLGGEPSVQPILSKRLFDDVSEDETKTGVIDYRCFYLHNESAADTLYNAVIYIAYTVPGDVTVQLGFDFENERQNLTVTNATSISGGSFTLTYSDVSDQYDVVVNYSASIGTWAGNLQTALRTVPNLEDVLVSGSISGTSAIFEIDFVGTSAGRFHETLIVKTNGLTPSATATVSVVKTVSGGPINRVADEIDVDTTTPNNVAFASSQITIGSLRPLDAVPIWVKRIVPANTAAVENDGFTLRVSGSAIAP